MIWFIKYNIEILTVIMFSMITLVATVIPHVTPTQKMLVVYMFLFTLHEWEENRYPGGFKDIMQKMMGKTFTEEAKEKSHIPVFVLLLMIHVLPFLFDDVIILVLIPVFLGIFEGFVHTMGVKLSKAEKFYTPGMVTAYAMLLFSVFCIWYFARNNMASTKDYIAGFLCMFVSSAIMQNRVLAIVGMNYSDMLAIIKSKLNK